MMGNRITTTRGEGSLAGCRALGRPRRPRTNWLSYRTDTKGDVPIYPKRTGRPNLFMCNEIERISREKFVPPINDGSSALGAKAETNRAEHRIQPEGDAPTPQIIETQAHKPSEV